MSYPGAKSGAGVYQTIINLMPPHTVYIEPFLGSGAVMRLKRPAAANIGVDVDAEVIARARSSLLPMVDGECLFLRGDAFEFLRRYKWQGGELVYCDPPYLRAARRSRRRLYCHEFNIDQHRRLLKLLNDLPCRSLISGYPSELYDDELVFWNRREFSAMTRGGLAREVVWFNYPPPAALHDYSFMGGNFREREKFKRRHRRWVERLDRMPELERAAMLAAIAELRIEPDFAGVIAAGGDGIRHRQIRRAAPASSE